MTRREWLTKNPPPKPAGLLLERADQLEATENAENKAAAARLRLEAQGAAKCPQHPTLPLYRHKNRPEDVFLCPNGPHFFLWTFDAGRAALVALTDFKNLPDIDATM
jgi:hypothetical protein